MKTQHNTAVWEHHDFRADLHVAPLGDALPAEEVSTGSRCGVSPLLQAEDAPCHSRACAPCMLRTADTQGSPLTIKTLLQSLYHKTIWQFWFSMDSCIFMTHLLTAGGPTVLTQPHSDSFILTTTSEISSLSLQDGFQVLFFFLRRLKH